MPAQFDLFAPAQADEPETVSGLAEPPPMDFVARIRSELEVTLARVREAASLPWPDLTRATLAELRFKSIANWLPPAEGDALRAAFEAELTRLYEAETTSRES